MFLLTSRRSRKNTAGSGSGSIGLRHGSADSDPYRNVTDSQIYNSVRNVTRSSVVLRIQLDKMTPEKRKNKKSNLILLFGGLGSFFWSLEALSEALGEAVLRIRIRDPGSGIWDWVLFDPWIRDPGWEKVSIRIRDPGSGMNNPDHIFLELRNHFFAFFGVKIPKFFDEDPGSGIRDGDSSDPGSGMEKSRIRDPG